MSTWRTFEQWNRLGYLIRKGERATVREGRMMFSNEQVKEKRRFTRDTWADADDVNTCGGPMFGIYGDCG